MKKAIKMIGKAMLSIIGFMLALLLALSFYHKALLSDDNRQMNEQYSKAQDVYTENI